MNARAVKPCHLVAWLIVLVAGATYKPGPDGRATSARATKIYERTSVQTPFRIYARAFGRMY